MKENSFEALPFRGNDIPVMPKNLTSFFNDVPQINMFNVGCIETEPFRRLRRKQIKIETAKAKKMGQKPPEWFLGLPNSFDDNPYDFEDKIGTLYSQKPENKQEQEEDMSPAFCPELVFYFLRVDGVALIMTESRYIKLPLGAEKIDC